MSKRTISGMMLILSLLGTLTLVFNASLTQAGVTTRIYLDPPNYIFDSGNGIMGTCFNVTVRVEDVANLSGFQVQMYFDDGIINVTRWFEPVWDTAYVFYGKTTWTMPSPPAVSYQHIGSGNGSATVYAMLFPMEQPTFNGNGKLCILEFNITAMPGIGEALSCDLNIDNQYTYLLDPDIEEIPAAKENGYYQLSWVGPIPYITQPLNCSLIYGDGIEVIAAEMNLAPNIIKCAFEYSQSKTGPWTLIELDTNSTDGWSTYWNLTGLSDGDYWIRATMINNVSQFGEDLAHVRFDYTPPFPELIAPFFPIIVSGTTVLDAECEDEDPNYIDYTYFFTKIGGPCIWMNKTIPPLDMRKFNATNNPEGEGLVNWQDGNYSCAPAAAASCLAYWDSYVNSTGQRPYDKLYVESDVDNDQDKYPDALEEMARQLYIKMRTNQPGSTVLGGIRDYINGKGLTGELEVTHHKPGEATLNKAIKEFMECQDVIAGLRLPGENGIYGDEDDLLHVITISSVHFEFHHAGTQLVPNNVDIDFMDPGIGNKTDARAIGRDDLENNRLRMDWNNDGRVGDNEFATLIEMITVCPKKPTNPKWVPIGRDSNGTDGWSLPWNTGEVTDGFYLVRATMTDVTGNTGKDTMLVYVDNARVRGITPNKTVVGEGYLIDIQVSVENLYVESAFFNITLYANETLIGKANTTLASQTSTTLLFTWNTTGMQKGNYTISVKTSVLLNETDLSRLDYIDDQILVTIPGDINGDFKCEGKDNAIVAKAYDTWPGKPKWDPNADINNDGKVEGKDVAIIAKYYDTQYP